MKLKKKLKIFREIYFNNHLPIHINFNHFVYNRINMIANKPVTSTPQSQSIKNNILNDGYSVVPNLVPSELISRIKEKANTLYKDGNLIDKSGIDAGLSRIKNCLINVPEILEIMKLPEINNAFKSIYNGNFRFFDADIYRTEPKKRDDANFGSQKWHFDNVPSNMVKLMIYLMDIDSNNGAMKAVSKADSKKIRKLGYLQRSQKEFEPIISENAFSLEAKEGTGVFFKPQECIHQAAVPVKGHRDVIVLMAFPSIKEQDVNSDEEKIIISSNRSYLKNPFTGSGV